MLPCYDSAFSSGGPFTRLARLALGVAALAGAFTLGCTPKIGDDCTVSTNCSSTGDRLCDVTQPGGYCTKFNCEPGGCPDDSVCVNFGSALSAVPGCTPSQDNSPYKRSFCMASCGSDSDCRGGYRCLGPTEFNAVLAEHQGGSRVCAVPPNPVPSGTSNEVCLGSDAGATPDEGGSSSSAGAAGGPVTSGAGDGGASPAAGAGGTGG
jgi:hypothetical protein